jgi:hypothetical protein
MSSCKKRVTLPKRTGADLGKAGKKAGLGGGPPTPAPGSTRPRRTAADASCSTHCVGDRVAPWLLSTQKLGCALCAPVQAGFGRAALALNQPAHGILQ